MGKWRIVLVSLLLLWLGARSGKFLVVDQPQKSDTILVLAGETDRRPARALELLGQGYAGRVILDVPADASAYGTSYMELARRWAHSQPQASLITICPIYGRSTKEEATDAAKCIRDVGGSSILIVTSDFHARRARSVLRRCIIGHTFQVAAAYDLAQFGEPWWRHRQWAKTNVDEWLRLLWWEVLDRWF